MSITCYAISWNWFVLFVSIFYVNVGAYCEIRDIVVFEVFSENVVLVQLSKGSNSPGNVGSPGSCEGMLIH